MIVSSAVSDRHRTDAARHILEIDLGEAGAAAERRRADRRHRIGEGDLLQRSAVVERRASDRRRFAQIHRGEVRAARE